MQPTDVCVQWCGEYEIHSAVPAEGPVTVYYPLTQEAFTANFRVTPGLIDRDSIDFDPEARPAVGEWSSLPHRFVVTPEGIHMSSPHMLAGVIEHLSRTGGMKHVFRPSDLPAVRWENVRLTELPVPTALQDYTEVLRGEFRNGFVETRRFQIEPGEVEDAVVARKRFIYLPSQFLEIFRHPMVKAGFDLTTLWGEQLLRPTNWTSLSPFLFSGHLAQTLAYGGAYSESPPSPATISRALKLADEVFSAFGRDYHGLALHSCHAPWCNRICGDGWDHTRVILEDPRRRFTILLAADND
jgi:hypothetical protein